MSGYPKVSVVIPVYNSQDTIVGCVESVLRQDYPNFDVIVVDDASRDDSASLAGGLGCKLIRLGRNSGPGVARNRGVEESACDIVAFLDADCQAPSSWLKRIVDNFKQMDVGAVCGGYNRSLSRSTIALFQHYDTAYRQRNVPEEIHSCITSNFASRRNAFVEMGGFPAKRINEDMEFGLLFSSRYKIAWDKDNGVSHRFDNSLKHYFTEQIKWAQTAVLACLNSPKAVSKNNTWNNGEIFMSLLLTALLIASIPVIFFGGRFILLTGGLALVYTALNWDFARFVTKKEGLGLAMKMLFLTLVRNSAWLAGVIWALARFSVNIFGKGGENG